MSVARDRAPAPVRALDRDALSAKILAAWKTLLGENYCSNPVGELLRRTLDAVEADALTGGRP